MTRHKKKPSLEIMNWDLFENLVLSCLLAHDIRAEAV